MNDVKSKVEQIIGILGLSGEGLVSEEERKRVEEVIGGDGAYKTSPPPYGKIPFKDFDGFLTACSKGDNGKTVNRIMIYALMLLLDAKKTVPYDDFCSKVVDLCQKNFINCPEPPKGGP